VNLGPPKLDRAAYHGLPGRVVTSLAPHVEADEAALLLHFLPMFGNAAGAGLHIKQGAPQPARLNVVLVGDAAFARKGTAGNAIEGLMAYADPDWHKHRILRGAQSAEAIIAEVDDERARDRRLLIFEHEFGRLLRVLQQQANLSDVLKLAYDGGPLQILTKDLAGRRTATRSHISVVGHVTIDILGVRLSDTEIASGFGNRFLYGLVARSKVLDRSEGLPEEHLEALGDDIADALEFATDLAFSEVDPISAFLFDYFGMQPHVELERTEAFWELWAELYRGPLNRPLPGVVGHVLERASTHVVRLAVCYALCDRSKVVDREHLEAAYAVWRYCAASARRIFGGITDSRAVDMILHAFHRVGRPITGTEVTAVFNRKKSAKELEAILGQMVASGLVTHHQESTKGRPKDIYTLVPEGLEAWGEESPS